jgi:hypothetical protein
MKMVFLRKRKTHLAVEEGFSEQVYKNPFFEKETLQELQQGHKLDRRISLKSDLWPNLPPGREGM